MESEVVWWQTSGCHTGANSRASEANATRLWISLSQVWIPLSRQKGCRAPFGQTKQATMISHLYQFYLKNCLFCFLVCLLSLFGWWFFFFSFFRSVECRQFCDTQLKGVEASRPHLTEKECVHLRMLMLSDTESTLSSSDHASPPPNSEHIGNKIVWPFPTPHLYPYSQYMSKVMHPWG